MCFPLWAMLVVKTCPSEVHCAFLCLQKFSKLVEWPWLVEGRMIVFWHAVSVIKGCALPPAALSHAAMLGYTSDARSLAIFTCARPPPRLSTALVPNAVPNYSSNMDAYFVLLVAFSHTVVILFELARVATTSFLTQSAAWHTACIILLKVDPLSPPSPLQTWLLHVLVTTPRRLRLHF